MSRPVHPDTLLGIRLAAILSRHRYTADPGPVIAEVTDAAGARTNILAMEAGRWAGYYDDEHTAVLVAAVVAGIPGATAWTAEGRARRAAPAHGTTGFGPAYTPPVAE